MAEAFNGQVLMDQPAGTGNRPYAAESWLEPWLIKHSEFYRKHFTRDGRRESKSTRRHSIVTEGLESRKNSIAIPEAASGHGSEPTAATPVPVEQPRTSTEAEAAAVEHPEALNKKDRVSAWRRSIGWLPHP
ncbi:hypothetical protein G647_05006 [Cladophialophora carrionii CBS 160.54]|uniref:Uncharacterized protein n=2 Tax=Cladophialophora carrionii TaxID=86049 RepID=A0A1C1D2P6_9EURO|nr:uncharacterized protein G647_05006 [Cladophialophora carrionii CBS 160.54]ETI23209.1 hypothetical protein G647_05006 [Cladophialophora carrionii CBS 160.54]OCT54915.1 hypothetical protein CLCR_03184 [Cladophialophora carrionii]